MVYNSLICEVNGGICFAYQNLFVNMLVTSNSINDRFSHNIFFAIFRYFNNFLYN
ncbi:hypothetical protein I871_00010 [Borrelia miyamotoi LB-2001]|nr:hypothetical protein I871_00010 [Borrelia miyamotoi LB-2001]